MGKKTVRGHDIANRFVYSLKGPAAKRHRTFFKSYFYNERIKRWNEALPSSVHL